MDPKAGGDSSRGIAPFRARFKGAGVAGPVVLVLGIAAAVLMLLTEASNIVEIDVTGAGCEDAVADPAQAENCEITGADQHSFALVALAVLTAAMAVGAGLGGSRPAAAALIGTGAVVLAIALLGDLPDTTKTGEIGSSFTSASAVKGPGFWFELAAGGLAVAAGALALLRRRVSS